MIPRFKTEFIQPLQRTFPAPLHYSVVSVVLTRVLCQIYCSSVIDLLRVFHANTQRRSDPFGGYAPGGRFDAANA